jgi:hypothetical protein
VLETAGTSAGPPVGPVPRPDAARVLLVVAAVGGLLTVGLVQKFATPLPAAPHEVFLRLVKDGRVARVAFVTEDDQNKWVEVELKESKEPPKGPKGPPPWLVAGKFTTDYPEQGKLIELTNFLQQHGVQIATRMQPAGSETPLRPPPVWGLVPVFGLPLLVAFVLGRTLGAPHWFPVLGRPRRPVAA